MMKCVVVVPQTNISEIHSAYITTVDFINSSIMVLITRKDFSAFIYHEIFNSCFTEQS
jgi:hypothetical protein